MKTLNSVDTDFGTFLKGIPDFFRLIGAVRHQKERRQKVVERRFLYPKTHKRWEIAVKKRGKLP